jgi:hypothetical protein
MKKFWRKISPRNWGVPFWKFRPRLKEAVSSIVIPVPDLPQALVERLRKIAEKQAKRQSGLDGLYAALGKMKNIDYRQHAIKLQRLNVPQISTSVWGRRVREMNVSRNFPGAKAVLKRTHNEDAKETVKIMSRIVHKHNQTHLNEPYVLLEPKAHPIFGDLLLMPKIDVPSVLEIVDTGDGEIWQTMRGKEFFGKLQKQFGVTESDLRAAATRLSDNSGIDSRNVWLLGYADGKFVFMPMLDIE